MSETFFVDGNGARVPARGFGTFQLRDDMCRNAVKAAIGAGYRHIDTAAMYGNEAEVGDAIRSGNVARQDIFVTTKVWRDDIAEEDLLRSAQASLKRLSLEQVDLLLIHWPNDAIPLESSIKGLCRARSEGLTRLIGVSNFPVALLAEAVRLADAMGEKLTLNQCEYHPKLDQSKVIAACRSHGMAFTSYSPLGHADYLEHSAIGAIAARLGRKPSQIVLRWHLQQGVIAIPRSSTQAHIVENFSIADFTLSDADMAAIASLRSPLGRIISPAFAPAWDT